MRNTQRKETFWIKGMAPEVQSLQTCDGGETGGDAGGAVGTDLI